MNLSEKRISELSDRLICHILYRRTHKAVLIAQAIRRSTGYHLANVSGSTGYSVMVSPDVAPEGDTDAHPA